MIKLNLTRQREWKAIWIVSPVSVISLCDTVDIYATGSCERYDRHRCKMNILLVLVNSFHTHFSSYSLIFKKGFLSFLHNMFALCCIYDFSKCAFIVTFSCSCIIRQFPSEDNRNFYSTSSQQIALIQQLLCKY